MQAPNRKFYDDFGTRIRVLRDKRGISLAELSGGGSASTAKSWEGGALPRSDKWDEIAQRLSVSSSFLIFGKPTIEADYDFIAKYIDEIGEHPSMKPKLVRPPVVRERIYNYHRRREREAVAAHAADGVPLNVTDCRVLSAMVLARAAKIRGGLGLVYNELRRILVKLEEIESTDPLIDQLRQRIAANPADPETREYLQHLEEDGVPDLETGAPAQDEKRA